MGVKPSGAYEVKSPDSSSWSKRCGMQKFDEARTAVSDFAKESYIKESFRKLLYVSQNLSSKEVKPAFIGRSTCSLLVG